MCMRLRRRSMMTVIRSTEILRDVVAVIAMKCFQDEVPGRRLDLSEEIARRRITSFVDLPRVVRRKSREILFSHFLLATCRSNFESKSIR